MTLVGFGNSNPQNSNEYHHRSHWSIPVKLRRNEYCPIHRSLFCCGREQAKRERRFQLGVQRIEDPHHPRGYRELRSSAEIRKLLNRKIVEQDGKCAICRTAFADYNEIVPDHLSPKAWEGPGEMTIPTMSKQSIGGAISKRGREDYVPVKPFDWHGSMYGKPISWIGRVLDRW